MPISTTRKRDAPRSRLRVSAWPGVAWPFALALALMLVVVAPVTADASPLVEQNNGSRGKNYFVSESNDNGPSVNSKFSAACWMCGINPKELDLEKRAVLSNAETGGKFYEFAAEFELHMLLPWEIDSWSLPASFIAKIVTWGDSWRFWAAYGLDPTLYSGAMSKLAQVMRGEYEQSGESYLFTGTTTWAFRSTVANSTQSVPSNTAYVLSADSQKYWNRFRADGTVGNWLVPNPQFSLRMSYDDKDGLIRGFVARYPLSQFDYFYKVNFTTAGKFEFLKIYAIEKGKYNLDTADGTKYWNGSQFVNVQYISTVSLGENATCGSIQFDPSVYSNHLTSSYVFNGSTLSVEVSPGTNDTYSVQHGLSSVSLTNSSSLMNIVVPITGINAQGGITEPGNWPQDDTDTPTPDPPTPPEPDPPTPPDPPDPIPPDPPVYDPDPTGTDYVPYLLRIIHELQGINTSIYYAVINLENAMNEHCQHIRAMMAQCLGNLEEYMYDCCVWLASQLSFDVSAGDYDDSTVVTWLKKIYEKITTFNFRYPSNRPSRRDIDDGFDWWGWLLQTIADIFGEGFEAGIEGYLQLLQGVIDKFPFSIPWDFLAVYGLLVAVPATPVFDITIPAINGWWSAVTFHVDLTPFNHVAGAVRHMVMLLWIVVLIRRTKWMTGIFESGALVVSDFLHNRG